MHCPFCISLFCLSQLQGLLEKEVKVSADLAQRLERQQARNADLQKSLEVGSGQGPVRTI